MAHSHATITSYFTSVEYKLTRFILWLLIFYNTAVIIVNALVKGKQYPFYISAAGIAVNIILLYLLHREKTYRQVPVVLTFFIYSFTVLSWLRIGGVYSSVPFVYLAFLAAVIVILPVRQGAYVAFLFVLTGILLSAIQILTDFRIIAGPNQIALRAIPYIFVLGLVVLAYVVYQMKKSLEKDRVILKSQKLQLEEQYEEIHQLNNYLEERVRSRTLELENSQRDLQALLKEKESLLNTVWQNELFLQKVLKTVPASVFVYTLKDEQTVFFNEYLSQALGYTDAHELPSGTLRLEDICEEKEQEKIIHHFSQLVKLPAKESPGEIIVKVHGKEKVPRWLLVKTAVHNDGSEPDLCQILGIATDITAIREKEKRIEEKNKQIIETTQQMANYKLMALRSTMNPHFLYNSLNAIQFFIARKDHQEAISYLSMFSRLIRKVITSSVTGKNQLSEEIEIIRYYLELEQMRFEDRFDWDIKVEESLLVEDPELPSLLIQPFVENAIIHGINNKEEKGHIQITLKKKDELLVCEVVDDGIGREAAMKQKSNKDHTSVGVMLTQERLAIINRSHPVSLCIEDLHDPQHNALGTRVTLFIEMT